MEVDTPEWKAMNRRRYELIVKEVDETITEEEAVELQRLQELSREVVERTFPF